MTPELPVAFEARMRRLLTDEGYSAFLRGYTLPLRRGLRVNTLKLAPARFLPLFSAPLTPAPFSDDSFYLDAPHKAGADPLHHAGAYYMQEPSASSAVTVLSPQRGEHILDLCAAPGGKSTQIAAALGGTGLLWCNEYVRTRAQVLLQNLERLGVTNAIVSNADTTPLCEQLESCFDAVLADVPCSGEGMFRKEPFALTQWSETLVAECAARGALLLDNAAKAVRAGGRLVYSTCTFAPEENEGQIARFLQRHPEFSLCKIDAPFGREGLCADAIAPFIPDLDRTLPLERCRRIFPADGGEGHFIALLQKAGDEARREAPLPRRKAGSAEALADALLHDCFFSPVSGELAAFGDTVRLLPAAMPATRGISILATGVAVGTLAKNRIEPHHALFAACAPQSCRRLLDLPHDSKAAAAFFHGETLAADCGDGYAGVAIDGISCGFGKVSRGVLKNHYPKGLRSRY